MKTIKDETKLKYCLNKIVNIGLTKENENFLFFHKSYKFIHNSYIEFLVYDTENAFGSKVFSIIMYNKPSKIRKKKKIYINIYSGDMQNLIFYDHKSKNNFDYNLYSKFIKEHFLTFDYFELKSKEFYTTHPYDFINYEQINKNNISFRNKTAFTKYLKTIIPNDLLTIFFTKILLMDDSVNEIFDFIDFNNLIKNDI